MEPGVGRCITIEGGAPADAPWVAGHFPGRPIVPGAILLGHAARLLDDAGFDLLAVRRMKFLQTLPPGRTFSIEVRPRGSDAEISWIADDVLIARAHVALTLR